MNPFRRGFKSTLFKIIFFLSFFLLILLSFLPLGLKLTAEHLLKKQGADIASIEDIDLNLFNGSFEINWMVVQFDDHPPFHLRNFKVDIDVPALLSKAVIIEAIHLEGIRIAIERLDYETFVINGFTIPMAEQEVEVTEEPKNNASEIPSIEVQSLTFADWKMSYSEFGFKTESTLNSIQLDQFSSIKPNEPAQLKLNAEIFGSRLSTDISLKAFAENKEISGHFNLTDLNLSELSYFYSPYLDSLQANVNFTSTFKVNVASSLNVTSSNKLQMADVQLKHPKIENTTEALQWTGDINLIDNEQLKVKGILGIKNSISKGDTQDRLLTQFEEFKFDSDTVISQLNSQNPQIKPSIHNSSQLELNQAKFQINEINNTTHQLRWEGSVKLENNSDSQIDGVLAIDDFSTEVNSLYPVTANFKELEFNTLTNIKNIASEEEVDASSPQQNINHQSKLTINDINLEYQEIKNHTQQINWEGSLQLKSIEIKPNLQGSLSIHNLSLNDIKNQKLISAIDSIILDQVSHTESLSGFDRFTLQNTRLLEDQNGKNLLKLVSLDIDNFVINHQQNSIQSEDITLTRPELYIHLDPEKKITHFKQVEELLARLQTQSNPTEDEVSKKAENRSVQPSPKINISQVLLKQPGQVFFLDESIAPSYETQIAIDQLKLAPITTSKLTDIQLNLTQGKYTHINASGNLDILNPANKADLNSKISRLDLPPISAYSTKTAGYGMKSGTVDADIKINIDKQLLDSNIDLTIDSIEVVQTDKETAEQMSSASGMSIDLALSTLKDENNVIELKIPVKGNLQEPDFDISQVVNLAMGKAMKAASMSYLKHTLQPFGSLITLYSLAEAAANHISLAPVEFETNSYELETTQMELLDKVTTLLNERPNLKIKACGVSSLQDQEAIRDALLKIERDKLKKQDKPTENINIASSILNQSMKTLADQRATTVKNYLVENKQVAPNQILNCLSESKLEKDSRPTVELLI